LIRVAGGAVPSNLTTPVTVDTSAGKREPAFAIGLMNAIELSRNTALSAGMNSWRFIVCLSVIVLVGLGCRFVAMKESGIVQAERLDVVHEVPDLIGLKSIGK
jgi:hypothetical protein